VRQAVDTALLVVIGQVNRLVFALSRGRFLLYNFRGRGLWLTITGPSAPVEKTASVTCLPDAGDYIVVAGAREEADLTALLDTCTAAVAGHGPQQEALPVDVIMVTGQAERAAVLKRILRHASIYQRHQVMHYRMTPIARLHPHHQLAADDASPAISEIRIS
jgi:hypothetical protein